MHFEEYYIVIVDYVSFIGMCISTGAEQFWAKFTEISLYSWIPVTFSPGDKVQTYIHIILDTIYYEGKKYARCK